MVQISYLNVSIGSILGFYSFEHPTPDMFNFTANSNVRHVEVSGLQHILAFNSTQFKFNLLLPV